MLSKLFIVHPQDVYSITSHSSNDGSDRLETERKLAALLRCLMLLTDRASHTHLKSTSGCCSKLSFSKKKARRAGKPNKKIYAPERCFRLSTLEKHRIAQSQDKPMACNADCGYLSVMREPIALVCFPRLHLQ